LTVPFSYINANKMFIDNKETELNEVRRSGGRGSLSTKNLQYVEPSSLDPS